MDLSSKWFNLSLTVVVAILVGALWNTPFLGPLKILTVFFHESSHSLAALLTGGSVDHMVVNPDQSGHALTSGWGFVTVSAGYLGSMIIGGILMVLAGRTRADRLISAALGVGLLVMTVLYVRNWFGFGFGILSGAVFLFLAWKANEQICDIMIRIVGVTSVLYAIWDIKSDILDNAGLRSDAGILSEMTGIPTIVWGVFWIGLAVVGALYFLYLSTPRDNQKTTRFGAAR